MLRSSGSVLIDDVTDWLMSQALGNAEIKDLFEGCCERLMGSGVPVSRGMLSFRTLHPLYDSVYVFWRRGEETSVAEALHGEVFTSQEFRRSTINHLLQTRTAFLRRRLEGETAQLDFPVLEDLHEKGVTDYLAYRVPFAAEEDSASAQDGIIGSWATERPGGFTDLELQWLLRVQRRLAVACKVQIRRGITHNVLATYIGRDAGEQVLAGQIRRGDGERIHAVIWYSDLRDSPTLADTMSSDVFLELVNRYFDCTAGAVMSHGGEVLRFIGDAVLAIFPLREGVEAVKSAACSAMESAREAELRLEALNAERRKEFQDAIDFGRGLHVGEVMFGNWRV